MTTLAKPWDYLIVTASNDRQADAYRAQLDLRRKLGMLSDIRQVLVVPDPDGRRVGSGGSTVHCLLEVLNRELEARSGAGGAPRDGNHEEHEGHEEHEENRRRKADKEAGAATSPIHDPLSTLVGEALGGLRILIVHAGGDSKRLPAYGPCGKVFIPLPGPSDTAIPRTLFDRQLPTYLDLPQMPPGAGQIVIVAGDDIKLFDPRSVAWAPRGFTALGCYASPELASRHGGFCVGAGNVVRRYFQKASPQRQREIGAVDRHGRAILDVAVINFDAQASAALLAMCDVARGAEGRLAWTGPMGAGIMAHGLDFFSDVCCALGTETTFQDYVQAIRAVGGAWTDKQLRKMFDALRPLPLTAPALRQCSFLHFGTTIQLITSGQDILRRDGGASRFDQPLDVNNQIAAGGRLVGSQAWVEGCRIGAELRLEGANIVTGVDVDEPLTVPRGLCLDVLPGRGRGGKAARFVRCYGSSDAFKDTAADGATFCNSPVLEWLELAGATPADVWPEDSPPEKQSLWTAKIVPAVDAPGGYKQWLWMFDPAGASEAERLSWRSADRYSLQEIALLADQEVFADRRLAIAAADRARNLPGLLAPDSGFSARDLAHLLRLSPDRGGIVAGLLAESLRHRASDPGSTAADFTFSRIVHSVGSAVLDLAGDDEGEPLDQVIPGLDAAAAGLADTELDASGLLPRGGQAAGEWARAARAEAVRFLGEAILSHGSPLAACPRNALRLDQIVWGRAPVRLELGGGWTDTPPYTLEYGGAVLNAAVNLNGQPPIQAYLRVIGEPVIRIGSIDIATRIEIGELSELLDYRRPGNEFALVKAALALSGFAPDCAPWPAGTTLRAMLEHFGGGIEITTLAGVPKGSGLGTSSILGAVILAVIYRAIGTGLTRRELFHKVLQLEQALTTGGGWQDQIGGAVDGVKITKTQPGRVPDPSVHMVPPDVLDPRLNGGSTILYYTGLTRLAKNILEQIVGRYLDRDRVTMEALAQEYLLAHEMADTMARRDAKRFGELIDAAWALQQKLCPQVTNEPIEELLSRVRPRIHGARILGAGSGGFLLMICKSPQDAAAIRQDLQARPLNDQARFFDFDISPEGLVVTVC